MPALSNCERMRLKCSSGTDSRQVRSAARRAASPVTPGKSFGSTWTCHSSQKVSPICVIPWIICSMVRSRKL